MMRSRDNAETCRLDGPLQCARIVRAGALGVAVLLAALALPLYGAETGAKLKVRDAAGITVFEVKCRPDGAKLVDGAEKELARLKSEPGRIRVKGPDESRLASVTGNAPLWNVEGPDGKTILFKYSRLASGDCQLTDGSDKVLLKLQKCSYGFCVSSAEGTTVGVIRAKGGKVAVEDAAGKLKLSVRESTDAATVAVLGLEPLSPPQRAGLWLALGGCSMIVVPQAEATPLAGAPITGTTQGTPLLERKP
jgi:hypothetical protein